MKFQLGLFQLENLEELKRLLVYISLLNKSITPAAERFDESRFAEVAKHALFTKSKYEKIEEIRQNLLDKYKPTFLEINAEKALVDFEVKENTLGLFKRNQESVDSFLYDQISKAIDPVKRPKVAKKETSVLDEQQAAQVFIALEPDMWRIMITLALTAGLRRGELLALEWKHVDLENGTLDVRQSLSYANGKPIIKEPKTKSSFRRVSLPSSVVSELKLYLLQCEEEKRKLLDAWEGGDHFFVFSATKGKPLYHTVPGTWFRRFIKRKSLPSIRFHDLRHTSATLLINQGVHAKTIAARLGHADIRTTMNIYGHALQSADQAAADKFETIFNMNA